MLSEKNGQFNPGATASNTVYMASFEGRKARLGGSGGGDDARTQNWVLATLQPF